MNPNQQHPNQQHPGQQHPNQQQQPNRLQLNFGFQNPNGFQAEQGRAFPTTPSTFPQPYPNSAGQQEVWGTNQNPNSGFTPAGYFANTPYPAQLQQQQQQNNLQAPSQAYRSPVGQAQYNDGTGGLVQQFQHQNLGSSPRSASPYGRQPSPAAPRQAVPARQPSQTAYNQYLSSTLPSQGPASYDDEPPMKNPERFSSNVTSRAKLQTELVGTFFKDSVERARDRNARSVDISHRHTELLLTCFTVPRSLTRS